MAPLAVAVAVAVLTQLACSEPATPGRSNLVLVTIDTVRADRIGAYGHDGAETPVLDGIAARGVRFDDAIAQATTTPPSHASILTGLNPARHGLRRLQGERLPEATETLAEMLQARGYATAAFVSALPLRRELGLDQGFEIYDDDLSAGTAHATAQTSAAQTNERVFRWLDSEPRLQGTPPQPLFLWVHYFDPHYPYDPPEPFPSRFGVTPAAVRSQPPPRNVNSARRGREAKAPPEVVVERMRRLYDAEMAYLDAAIGELLERLDDRGLLDDAVVAVVADHGEHFGEGGYYFGHWDVLEETARVPMLLSHSDGRHAGRVVERSVGTIDLLPTLLRWLGLEAQPGLDGIDLTPALEGRGIPERPIYTEQFEYFPVRAVRSGPWILRQFAAPRRPVEEGIARLTRRSDVSQARPELLSDPDLERAFQQAMAAASAPGAQRSEALEVSAEVRAQLEALGYTDEAGAPTEPAVQDPPR